MILIVTNSLFVWKGVKSEVLERQDKELTEWKLLKMKDYEMKYPSNWEFKEGMMGTEFFLLSPLSNKSDNFRENISLLVQDFTENDMTLDKYTELSEKQIKNLITDGKIILSKRLKNKNEEFQKVVWVGKQGGYDLKFEQIYRLIGDKAYVLTLTCKVDEFEKYQETGEAILNSFKLK